MKNLNSLLALCLLIACVVLSCSRSYKNSSTVSTPTYSSIDEVFAKLAVQPKVTTADAGTATTFYGSSGTRYIFPANCFQTASGTTVTGNVQISSSEYNQKGDMMFSKMLPISGNEPLLSGGEIDLSVSQNGQKLYLKPGMAVQANIPVVPSTIPATGFAFFTGQDTKDTTRTKVNWVQRPDTLAHPIFSIRMIAPDTLGIISDSLTRCNADRFMTPIPNYQNFTVTIQLNSATLTDSDVVYGYTLYDTYKGEWPLGYIGGYSKGVFTEHHVPNIAVHFVAFVLIKGKFYGGIISATPITGQNYTVTLTETDAADFKALVNKL